MEKRLVHLETKSAYQEHLIQELNEVVIAQQQQLDVLEHSMQQLRAYLRNLNEQEASPSAENPPPHY